MQNGRPIIPCVILAGGQSHRFGTNKAFAALHGERMIDVLIKRIECQTAGLIAINGSAKAFEDFGRPVLTDLLPGTLGPLAGLHAAMVWARQEGYDAVVTTPVDTPILPENYIAHLVATGAPSIATFKNRMHAVHGLWPVHMVKQLADAVEQGMRAARDWAAACKAVECEFQQHSGLDPFFNVNTPDDLRRLEKYQPDSPR